MEILKHNNISKIGEDFKSTEVAKCVKFILHKAMFSTSGSQFYFKGANSHILTLWECAISIQR